jgi:chemotaxis protein CheD
MNHFMLPDADAGGPAGNAARYGAYAMEVLINELIKLGAVRSRLEAKVFGGGQIIANMKFTDIGKRNAAFVRTFLRDEGIRVAAEDLGDTCPRKVYFFPASGRVLVKRLRDLHNNTIVERETTYRSRLVEAPSGGDVELFI